MRVFAVTILCIVLAITVFAQSDRGTLTGTVTDPAGAVVPNATVSAKNTETSAQYETQTTGTGNYTLPQLPAGPYEMSVTTTGFSKYIRQGLRVQVAQTMRLDVVLQVGSTSESVTVSAAAPLLKTEGAEQSYNIGTEQINALPLNFGIRGFTGGNIRSTFAFISLAPGARISAQNDIRINGNPTNSFSVRIEGQESTAQLSVARSDETQTSVEAVQEIAVQTSNFAPEFGQVAGGLFNFTTKSGTNQIHGTAYEYFVHEGLFAGRPYTNNGKSGLIRSKRRQHDFGFSGGGPVYLGKLYDGRDKTFFFVNFEMYREHQKNSGTLATVPTLKMRAGDFSEILTGRTLATDPLGRSILENAIYDPTTTRVAGGGVVRDVYAGNIIPSGQFDPIAMKIQSMIPAPSTSGLVNNFNQVWPFRRIESIPSIKIDHTLSTKSKISFYYHHFRIDHDIFPEGLPDPISTRRDLYLRTGMARLNYDRTITPTLLLHAGVGFMHHYNPDKAPPAILNYDSVKQLGLAGALATGFPNMSGMSNSYGGESMNFGVTNADIYRTEKPTAVLSATYIRSNHTYKIGADWRIDMGSVHTTRAAQGNYQFSNIQTALPSTDGQNLAGGLVGHPWASFLTGADNYATLMIPQQPQSRKPSWSLYAQDSWKVTRKLTLDYGLRWDLQTSPREIHNRMSMFGPTVPNPTAGGRPGGIVYEGFGPGRINGHFTTTYPYSVGPRIGGAYQIDAKTVFRGGWGISYGNTPIPGYMNAGVWAAVGVGNFNTLTWTSPSYGDAATVLRNGLSYTQKDLYPPTLDPGIRPSPNQINNPPGYIDRNAGRMPRINQWSISLQRELTKDLVAEAAYVGNRGAWITANNMIDLNALTADRIKSFGLDVNSAADRSLLTSRVSSSLAQSRGFGVPYAGWPQSLTVAQSLRPFPQFTNIGVNWAPLGNSWYDSLQTKLTKRFSYGLTFSSSFTFSKELTTAEGNVNDVFNRPQQKRLSPNGEPFIFVNSFNYEIPVFGQNKMLRTMLGGWTLGGVFRYASGVPILVPAANNALSSLLFRGTYANRVPGEPLYLQDLNSKFDPNKTFTLNPKAWTDPAPGQFGTSALYYNDYRYARRPDEQLSFGRMFRLREGMTLQFRAEFFNPFNRTFMNNPDSTNAMATQSKNASGAIVSGFGRINTGSVFANPRNGQFVLRFQF